MLSLSIQYEKTRHEVGLLILVKSAWFTNTRMRINMIKRAVPVALFPRLNCTILMDYIEVVVTICFALNENAATQR